MPEICITLYPDGTILIPRGSAEDNQFFLELLEGMVDKEELQATSDFMSATDDSEIIFGDRLCG